MKERRRVLTAGALIGVCFLLTGSEYITWWLYKLTAVFDGAAADVLSEGVGYMLQALGMALFAAFVKKNAQSALSHSTLCVILLLDIAATALAFFSSGAFGILAFGLLMNLLHGAVFAHYLTRLAQSVPRQRMGVVFGAAYAFGSVGSWLMSLPMGGAFLGSPYVLIAYAALAAVIPLLDRACEADAPVCAAAPTSAKPSVVPLAALVVVLLSAVKGMGFYFPTDDHMGGEISAVFMRVFYAVGLIAAGIVNDRDRRAGAVCCLAALICPFITFGLRGEQSVGFALWLIGYVLFGFFSVYRVVTFADMAGGQGGLLYLAGFGLMLGRAGDATGAACGVAMRDSFPVLLAVTSVLFAATVLLFFKYYNRTYAAPPAREESTETLLRGFEGRFRLSARESEVFRLIANGRSNSEIASDLYIAESTVKFHVKNILKKTACSNRIELIAALRNPPV